MPSPLLSVARLLFGAGLAPRALASATAATAALAALPWQLSAVEAGAWYHGDAEVQHRLANGVSAWVHEGVEGEAFATGSDLFDQEWVFGTYFMAAMGFGQLALQEPDEPRWLTELDFCLERLVHPDAQAFEVKSWALPGFRPGVGGPTEGRRALEAMIRDGRGHAAYLGYLDLALSLARRVDRGTRWADLHDRISATLADRLAADETGILETYPDQRYPVDNAAAVAALALRAHTLGLAPPAVVNTWSARVREDYLDQGVLVQSIRPDGTWLDRARGSGTFLASWFLSTAGVPLGQELWGASETLYGTVSGYGMMREHLPGVEHGGDIDSGPIVLGYGVSATGFALGPARIHRAEGKHQRLFATATLFGGPADQPGPTGLTRHYAAGGPLGDAILFAMLTAVDARETR